MFSGPSIPPDHRMTPHRTDDGPLLSGLMVAILAGVVLVVIVIVLVLVIRSLGGAAGESRELGMIWGGTTW